MHGTTNIKSSWRVIVQSQRSLPDNKQQSQQTDIHAPGGIRTRTPSKRAAADPDGGKIRHCRSGYLKWIDWGNKFDFLHIQRHSLGLLSFLSPDSRHISEERLSGSRHPSQYRLLKEHAHPFWCTNIPISSTKEFEIQIYSFTHINRQKATNRPLNVTW